MEVFVDFGLFELLALSGITVLGRMVFRRPATRLVWLAVSVAAPGFLVVWGPTELVRWPAAVALATTVVNAAVLLRANVEPLTQGAPAQPGPGATSSPG